jgi:hypothetical protein
MLVDKVDIIPSNRITGTSRRFLIPLEFICRWYVAGSLFDRVVEPLRVKTQAINSAAEAAVMILRIDDVIASKSGGAPGGGMPGGMPGGMGGEDFE